jgi:hypothetical protein
MPPRDERLALRLAVRGFVAVLLVLAAIPAYLTLAPPWRPLAARLACAALLAVVSLRVIRAVRASLDARAASALDTPAPPTPGPELDERFVRLRDEVVFSTRSRQYFESILWPRLQRAGAVEPPPRTRRRGPRRDGPSLDALGRLVTALEERA